MKFEAIVFDLDQTLVDTSSISVYRESREWEKCSENFHSTKVFQYVHDTIQKISKNKKIAIVTNSPKIYAEKLLNYHKIPYDELVAYNKNGRNKPYPDQLLSCAQKLQADAERCVYIGDDVIDIVAAKAAGFVSIGIAENRNKEIELLHAMPDLIISDFLELIKYISIQEDLSVIQELDDLKKKIKLAKSSNKGHLLFELLKKASELGDRESQFSLAKLIYLNPSSLNAENDYLYYFWKAALQMLPEAIHALGHFIEKDNKKEAAGQFYRTAAYLNDGRAKYKFAATKMRDDKSKLRLHVAKTYLEQSLDSGIGEAGNLLNEINAILNFEEELKNSILYDEKKEVFYLSDYIPSKGQQNSFSKEIIQVKQGEQSAIEYFTEILKEVIHADVLITYVPSSDMRKKTTGIKEIALGLSKFIGTNGTHCLQRTATKEKSSLGGERSIDIHFKTLGVQNTELLAGKHVLLLDDIVTSGSSLLASEQLLLDAGARYVTKLALGKTKS